MLREIAIRVRWKAMGGQMAEVIRLTGSGGGLDRQSSNRRTATAEEGAAENGIGQELCNARQRRGRTLMDVWHDIKIPPHHLTAIESGRFDELPGRVYAVGYVRTYAAYLGLDADPLVALLKARMGSEAGDAALISAPQPTRNEHWRADANEGEVTAPADRALLPALLGGLLMGLLIYSGVYVFASSRHMAMPPVTPVPRQLLDEAGLVGKPGPAASQRMEQATQPLHERALPPPPPPSVRAEPERMPVSVPPIAIALVEPALAPPATEPPPKPRPVQQGTTSKPSSRKSASRRDVLADIRPARFRAPLPLGQRYGLEKGKSRITLRLHRATRVVVQGPHNRTLIDRTLAAGDVYRIPDEAGLKLRAQDAGAVELILDDSTIGFAGKDGAQTVGLPLDPDSIARRARAY